MGMAELVVTAVLVESRSKSEVARDYGVSRRWVITLVQRYQGEGTAGLVARSRTFRSEIITGMGGGQVVADDPAGNPVELFEPAER